MKNKRLIGYAICGGAALAVCLIYAVKNNLFSQTSPREIFGILSDGFFIPGVIFGGVGGLIGIAGSGFFDILSYGVLVLYEGITHPKKSTESFYDYKLRKAEGRKEYSPCLLVVGLVCLALAGLCLIGYFAI